jgi:hypothetical protein
MVASAGNAALDGPGGSRRRRRVLLGRPEPDHLLDHSDEHADDRLNLAVAHQHGDVGRPRDDHRLPHEHTRRPHNLDHRPPFSDDLAAIHSVHVLIAEATLVNASICRYRPTVGIDWAAVAGGADRRR